MFFKKHVHFNTCCNPMPPDSKIAFKLSRTFLVCTSIFPPGVLGPHTLRRTVQVRLGTNTLRLSGGTPIFVVSLQQYTKYPGY